MGTRLPQLHVAVPEQEAPPSVYQGSVQPRQVPAQIRQLLSFLNVSLFSNRPIDREKNRRNAHNKYNKTDIYDNNTKSLCRGI